MINRWIRECRIFYISIFIEIIYCSRASRNDLEIATLGGGCFWCLEAVYTELKGVLKVESGYSGGSVRNPTYEDVCSDETGHAEVVQVTYDPSVITYREILQVFFSIHDPTTLNRQGADTGSQYRSVIFYQRRESKESSRGSHRRDKQE